MIDKISLISILCWRRVTVTRGASVVLVSGSRSTGSPTILPWAPGPRTSSLAQRCVTVLPEGSALLHVDVGLSRMFTGQKKFGSGEGQSARDKDRFGPNNFRCRLLSKGFDTLNLKQRTLLFVKVLHAAFC